MARTLPDTRLSRLELALSLINGRVLDELMQTNQVSYECMKQYQRIQDKYLKDSKYAA